MKFFKDTYIPLKIVQGNVKASRPCLFMELTILETSVAMKRTDVVVFVSLVLAAPERATKWIMMGTDCLSTRVILISILKAKSYIYYSQPVILFSINISIIFIG